MTGDKRKIGRPKMAPEEQRTERLSGIRLTAAERVMIEDMAAAAGLPLAEFCRRAILRQKITPPPSRADDALLLELNRIGVNINQIAHAVNAGRGLPHSMPEVMEQLRRILDRLAGVSNGP